MKMRPSVSPKRPASPKCYNRKSRKKNVKRNNVVDLIDAAFAEKLTITENGRRYRRTVLQEIYRQLWKKEMEGDSLALVVRLSYERLVFEQSPKKEREIIVIGGLPQ